METLHILPQNLYSPTFHMNTISANFRAKIRFNPTKFRPFCGSSLDLKDTHELVHVESCKKRVLRDSFRVRVNVSDAQLKENWLASLSCPIPEKVEDSSVESRASTDAGLDWITGIDPDVSGALALLKTDDSDCSAKVFDAPHLQVLVGKRARKRLDAKSVVELLRSFDAPLGTTAYIEQSIPFPKDGKQFLPRTFTFSAMKGWWSGGFGYGLWIGILVASGFSVVPVPSVLWKNHFELSESHLTKLASNLCEQMRRSVTAMKIQKKLRRCLAKKDYTWLRLSVLVLQMGLRAMVARNEFRFRKQNKAAIIIQAKWRCHRESSYYEKLRRTSIVSQCTIPKEVGDM